MVHTNIEQGSKEWHELRRGKATASKFGLIMAPRGLGKTAQDYALEIAGHSLIEIFEEQPQSYAMKIGTELEPYAAAAYELETLSEVKELGFISHAVINIGCSPDRLVGDDGGLEIKCPQQTKHLKNLASTECPKEYYDQIQGCMFIAGVSWWDFVSFNPNFKEGSKLKIIRVERDQKWVNTFVDRMIQFEIMVDGYRKTLNT